MTKTKSLRFCLLASTALWPLAPPAFADSDEAKLAEVIVTAQRKEERLQDVPITVNVITAQALESKGIGGSVDLENIVPGLTMQEQGPAVTPFLRGVGGLNGNPNNESSVAMYIDGVYIASPHAIRTDLNNLERIEVLKGPQGTLFGRNATGGVIQLVTRDPKHTPEVEASLGYGNFQTVKGSLYATTGLTDTLAMDVAVVGSHQGSGWGHNLTTGEEIYKQKDYSVRTKLLYTPTDDTTIRLAYDREYLRNNNVAYTGQAGITAADGYVYPAAPNYNTRESITTPLVPHPNQPEFSPTQDGVSANVQHDFSFGRALSISSFRQVHGEYFPAADLSPLPIVEGSLPLFQRNISQELQLQSLRDSSIDWTVGYFFFHSVSGWRDIDFSGFAFAPPGSPPGTIGHFNETGIERKTSHAVFAQDTISILPRLKLTTGLRFTHERSSPEWDNVNNVIPLITSPEIGFDRLTWRIALDGKITDDIHAYASYNRGVNGGGFNLLSPGDIGYRPETLDAYEIGVKSEFADHRVRLNAAAFKYYWKSIQVQIVPQNTGGAGIVETLNAGKATAQGLDVDFQALLVKGLTVSGGLTYLDDKYTSFVGAAANGANGLAVPPIQACTPTNLPNCAGPTVIDASGKPLIRAPRVTGNIGLAYAIPSAVGDFSLGANQSYNTGYSYEPANGLRQRPYFLLNMTAGWRSPDGHYGVTIWGNNLTNRYYYSQAVSLVPGYAVLPAAPRTYGINFSTKWGG